MGTKLQFVARATFWTLAALLGAALFLLELAAVLAYAKL
jgi:hypothetical protein